MLTKKDFSQIKKIVGTEARKVVRTETRKIVKGELKPIKRDITKIRKDVDVMLTLFDREYLDLRKRVEKIEEHLGFPSMLA